MFCASKSASENCNCNFKWKKDLWGEILCGIKKMPFRTLKGLEFSFWENTYFVMEFDFSNFQWMIVDLAIQE